MEWASTSIANRVKGRKLFQQKVGGEKATSSKFLESDTESENEEEYVKKIKGFRRRKRRDSGQDPEWKKSRRSSSEKIIDDDSEVVLLDDSSDSCRSKSQSSDSVEFILEIPDSDSWMNLKGKSMSKRKNAVVSEEGKECDVQELCHSNSEPEIFQQSSSRSKNENLPAYPKDQGQRGLGTKKLVEEHTFEEKNMFQGKSPAYAQSSQNVVEEMRSKNAKNEGNSNNVSRRNSNAGRKLKGVAVLTKNNSSNRRNDDSKFRVRATKIGSKTKKVQKDVSIDYSSTSCSSDTESDDRDDEDFRVEESYSSVGVESPISLADEEDEEFSWLREGESTKEEVKKKPSSNKSKPLLSEEEDNKDMRNEVHLKENLLGKKWKTNCSRDDGKWGGDNGDSQHETFFEAANQESLLSSANQQIRHGEFKWRQNRSAA